jgi:hypothetical protein
VGAINEIQTGLEKFLIHRFHPFGVQWASVFDLLRAVRLCPAVKHTAWPKLLLELGVFWIVRTLWFLFRVQVIEITEELVDSMNRGQKLVPITKMVFAKLSRGIPRGEKFGDGQIFSNPFSRREVLLWLNRLDR